MLARGEQQKIQTEEAKIVLLGGSIVALLVVTFTFGWQKPVLLGIAAPATAFLAYQIFTYWKQAKAKAQERLHLEIRHQCLEELGQHLGIGLFLSKDNQIHSTNKAWDELVGRREGETPAEALQRTGFIGDLQSQNLGIQTVADFGLPAETIVRHTTDAGVVRHLQTYSVPASASGENVVGFTVDVSAAINSAASEERQKRERANMSRLLRHTMDELNSSLEALVRVLVRAVEAKDPYTAGHSERVTMYAIQLGQLMGLDFHELRTLEIGCLVHDIGKIGIPDHILTKPDKLTEEEYSIVSEHPDLGCQILEGLPLFKECLPIVRNHHERLDGSGYPNQLKGDQISLMVRIAMVADAFDAMTSTRAYRDGMHPLVAMAELEKDAEEGRLDPLVVEVFADMVRQDDQPARPRKAISEESPRPSDHTEEAIVQLSNNNLILERENAA